MCSAGVGLSTAGFTGNSREQLTLSPIVIERAASSRFSAVMKFSAPLSSSAPQRPQFFTFSKTSRMYCGVHSESWVVSVV